jgi:hypothetical protein
MKKLILIAAILVCAVPSLVSAQGLGTDNTWTNNNRFKGPTPFCDVTAYGARSVSAVPQAIGNMTGGNNSLNMTSPPAFVNGDGITVLGAGATNTLSTPGSPIVVPSVAVAGMATGLVANGQTGASTYSYKVVARDKYGALTAAGPATTITTGQATLGTIQDTITTATRTNDSVTYNVSSASKVSVETLIHVQGTSNADFDGWFNVTAIDTTNHLFYTVSKTSIDSRGLGWQRNDSASSSGGTSTFVQSNHLSWTAVTGAWEYYIYGKRPGDSTFNLMGVTHPSANGWFDTQWDDYGATIMAGQTFPLYVTTTAPGVATNDPLTTTVLSGGGGTSLVLAKPAINSVTGATILFDDGPAFQAAATAAAFNAPNYIGATLYIPATANAKYVINSFITIPALLTVQQVGLIQLNETMFLQGSTNWSGSWGAGSIPSFGFSGRPYIQAVYANPGIYQYGAGNTYTDLAFLTSDVNGGTAIVANHSYSTEFDYVSFNLNGGGLAGDYLSMALIEEGGDGGGDLVHFRKVVFDAGPSISQYSTVPLLWFPPSQDMSTGALSHSQAWFVYMTESVFNRRGIEHDGSAGGGGRFILNDVYRQGGISPLLATSNNNGATAGTAEFHNVTQDTETAGTLALWGYGAGSVGLSVDMDEVANSSSDVGGPPPPITGQRPRSVKDLDSYSGTLPNRGTLEQREYFAVTYPYEITGTNTTQIEPFLKLFEEVDFPAKHGMFWDLGQPSAVTVGAPTTGGSLTASTAYYYVVTAIGVDQGETVPSSIAGTNTTTVSNKTLPVSWTGIAGARSYDVYRCTGPAVNCVGSDGRISLSGNYRLISTHVAGTSITDAGLGVGQGFPQVTGTGSTGINANYFYAPQYLTTSPMVGGVSYVATHDSPISANHSYHDPDMDGTYLVGLRGTTGTITGTALTNSCDSGTVSITGALPGMPVHVSTTDGTDIGGAFNIRASVTASGSVTVFVCGNGTPPNKAYSVRVIQ